MQGYHQGVFIMSEGPVMGENEVCRVTSREYLCMRDPKSYY